MELQNAHVVEYFQGHRGWHDYGLEADHWAAMGDIEPTDAAMLLCCHNPNESNFDVLNSDVTGSTSYETPVNAGMVGTAYPPKHLRMLARRLVDIAKAGHKPRTLRDWHQTARENGLAYHSWIDGYMEATALPSSELDGMPEREMTAAFAETVYNGKVIDWRYWVHQLPALTAGEASLLLCALDPDLFQDLENRPNRNDPSRHCKNALMIERLAEREGKESATPAEWLAWADGHQITVHDGFRLKVDSLGIGASQQIQFADTEAGVSTTYRMTQSEHDQDQQDKQARQDKGYYTMSEVAQILADTYSLDAAALLKKMKADYHSGNLTIRSRDTEAPVLQNHNLRDFYDWMFPDDIRAMLAHWKWSREFPFAAQIKAPATDPNAGPVSASAQPETPAQLAEVVETAADPVAVAGSQQGGAAPLKRRTWRDVAMPYVIETFREGQYATAKELFNQLYNTAGTGKSPFSKGKGIRLHTLFVDELSKPLALKTLENAMNEIRVAAKKR